MHMVTVWVAVGKRWLSLPGQFFSSLAQNGIGTGPLCRSFISCSLDSDQLREASTGWRALTIVS